MSSFEKVATTPAARDRLRHEAALLSRARHPGVVAVEDFEELDGRTRLALARPTDTTLAAAPPTDARRALQVLAALAATVADLHGLGIAHRRLQPDHVLLVDGRPFLCGFAGATGLATDEDRRLDDAALRDLVDLLAGHARSGGAGDRATAALRRLATPAPDGGVTPAAELARRAGRAAGRTPRRQRTQRATPLRRAELATVGAAAIIATVVLWPGGGAPGSLAPTSADPPPAASPLTTAIPATTTSGPLTASPVVGAPPAPDRPVQVHAGGADYEVGRAGDQVAIADWTCTGAPSAALLRPGTGELFLFVALPDAGETTSGRHIGTIAGARELMTDRIDEACPTLSVRDASGTVHRIGAS